MNARPEPNVDALAEKKNAALSALVGVVSELAALARANTARDEPIDGYECAHGHHWYMPRDVTPRGCPMCNTITFRALTGTDT